MRSPIGPAVVIIGLATTVVLVLLLFQGIGTRSDLESARAELAELRAQVESQASPVDDALLIRRLDELEAGIRDWLIATGVDGPSGSPGAGGSGDDEILDRLDQVLERINALDDRVDQICEGVPVC